MNTTAPATNLNVGEVTDSYQLAPLQAGMLFNHLYLRRPGVDLMQLVVRLAEPVRPDLLELAWQKVAARHPVLRTSFEWENVPEPVQQVHGSVQLRIDFEDLRHQYASEKETINSYLQKDSHRGFDLRSAPLMRLKLFQFQDSLFTLVWSFHHILVDGRAFMLVLQEALSTYDALTTGVELEVAPERPYREFVEQAQQPDLAKAEDFWREKLKDFSAPIPLLQDNPAYSDQDLRGQREYYAGEELTRNLVDLASAQNVTLNTIVQGAWALLLSRYSGEHDIVFGSSKSVRHTLPDGKQMIGLLLATIPVRIQINEQLSVAAWLQQLRAEWLSYRGFEHTPLTTIQRATKLAAGTRLFESLVVFENESHIATFRQLNSNCATRELSIFYSDTGYPLTLMGFGGTQLNLTLCYDRSKFSDALVDRMLGHLRTLLEEIVADPRRSVGSLSLLTEAERQQLLVDWNDTAREYPYICVHEFFQRQAARTPHAVAVVCGKDQLTYAELERRSNQLARYLQKKVQPEALVGLYLDRTLDMMIAMLGVLKAGAAYVPLDPAYPKERIAFIAADANLSLLVTHQKLVDTLPPSAAELVVIDSDWKTISAEADYQLEFRVNPESVAYVLYTSGSTGKPKGVQIEHRAVANLFTSIQQQPGITSEDVVVAVTTLSFDIAELELYLPLTVGARVVIGSREHAVDGQRLIKLLADNAATIFQATPATWRLLVDSGWPENSNLKIFCGGEALAPDLAAQMLPRCRELWNMYGPTETTIYSVICRIEKVDWAMAPIGRPIANTHLYVLDSQRRPVPLGVAGELYIGGAGLARGYWRRPELTAEKFVANPFRSGDRLYRTGDLVRYLADGTIQYLGRIDNQVKIRGYRIELGEIESSLAQHAGVEQAVVVAREDKPGDKRLVAYFIPAQEGTSPEELRRHLRQNLPEYMVPSTFIALERFPLTPNRKVDRRTLPAPDETAQAGGLKIQPRTNTEVTIAAIWEEVLRVHGLGVTDNFFDLGHSLNATQVMSRIRRALGVDLLLRVLFENPTIESLAKTVDEAQAREQVNAMTIVPVARDQHLPLSFAQQRMWFIHQMDPDNPVYNIPLGMRLIGPLNVPVLEQSLNEIIRRHEILRTTFKMVDDVPVQVIAPDLQISVKTIDLSNAAERDQEADRVLQEHALTPFSLTNGPLLRATLARLSEHEHVLLLTLHHIAGDAWSAGVLFQELSALYPALLAGRPSPLSPLTIQYADYAAAQRKWLQAGVLEQELTFWKRQLQGAPTVLELPADHPRPEHQSFRGGWHNLVVPEDLLQAIKAFSQQHGATLFMTLMAAFQVLVGRYAQSEDFVIGTDLANRTSVETERLIGFFINVLPIRANLAGNPTFVELLGRVRETTMNAFAHQEVPLDKLVEGLQPERTLSHNALIQVLFVLQNATRRTERMGDVALQSFELQVALSKFDLAVFFEERGEELSAGWLYVADLFDAATIDRMAARYQMLLQSIVAQPDTRISNLEMLTPEEKQQELLDKQERRDSKGKKLKMARRKTVEVSAEAEAKAIGN